MDAIALSENFSCRGMLLDLDGVVWRRNREIPGAARAVSELSAAGIGIVFLSNNSSESRDFFVEKLRRIGIDTDLDHVVSSPFVAARYLAENRPSARVFPVGMPGLVRELEEAGVITTEDPSSADTVVAGYCSALGYDLLGKVLKALMNGAEFFATNDDGILPTEDGYMPGAGATIGAIRGMVKREPDMIMGKPNDLSIRYALGILGLDASDCILVGDSLATDIALAEKMGMRSILVLSGNTRSPGEAGASPWKPTSVAASLADVPAMVLGGAAEAAKERGRR
jgi:HAD superfamily hydrolase (TIGR01450 family)